MNRVRNRAGTPKFNGKHKPMIHRRFTLDHPLALIILLSLLLCISASLYLPGVSGPYLFDDYTNLLDNSYLKIQSLNPEELRRASFSLAAGPLQRPVAMASFAINHYFAGSFRSTAPYKLVNILIHLANGVLLFWLARLLLQRYAQSSRDTFSRALKDTKTRTLFAFAAALLWVLHPIQMTSVLYIVQRMTELATLFMLLAIICYVKGRTQWLQDRKSGLLVMVSGVAGFGCLALYSKENAILLPLFLLVVELAFFANEMPWKRWPKLTVHWQRGIVALIALAFMGAIVLAVSISLPYYEVRNFTPSERLLTEGRVVFFYLSLILAPRINDLGLLHDDIPLSTSILSPWTTLPALLGITALIVLAIRVRRTHALLSVGILWFFAGHALESTIFPLEIAHEHRNYIASFGAIGAIVYLIALAAKQTGRQLWVALLPAAALVFGLTTYLRATQWSEAANFYRYEAIHHPRSPGAQMSFGMVLFDQGLHDDAMRAFRTAAELDTKEAGLLVNMLLLSAKVGHEISSSDNKETLKRLTAGPLTASSSWALKNASGCILDKCRALAPYVEEWMNALLNRSNRHGDDRSFYQYLLARALVAQEKYNEAVDAYRGSYELDRQYLHPLLELGALYVRLERPDYAQVVLAEIRRANSQSRYPKNREIAELEAMIAETKKGGG